MVIKWSTLLVSQGYWYNFFFFLTIPSLRSKYESVTVYWSVYMQILVKAHSRPRSNHCKETSQLKACFYTWGDAGRPTNITRARSAWTHSPDWQWSLSFAHLLATREIHLFLSPVFPLQYIKAFFSIFSSCPVCLNICYIWLACTSLRALVVVSSSVNHNKLWQRNSV